MEMTETGFSPELSAFIAEWKDRPGNLIMLLHKIQEEYGYIPRVAAEGLARAIDLPLAKIYGVITFYHFFKTTKPGKNRIAICLGTACYLKGSQGLLDEARDLLGIDGEEVTDDGLFSIDAVRCLGCCGLAPVLMVGNDVHAKVSKEELVDIIAKYKSA
ncbi:MAG TPA: NAD(P)H-dependent oxidoreductase subunit E [Rectinemataceae bacterium]|nr:NAD(P)H-dependent oxidoreductase subunit E [Rectinemataceae bacterium]